MINTISYCAGLISITALYIGSYSKAREQWRNRIEECIDRNEKSLKWWHRRYEDLEKEKDELAVKLCEAEMWCEGGAPCDNSRVLVCSVTTKGEKRINIAYYEDGKWHGNGNLDNVIAWKSLPEMPDNNDEK